MKESILNYLQEFPPHLMVQNGKLTGLLADFFEKCFPYVKQFNTTYITDNYDDNKEERLKFQIRGLQTSVDANIFVPSLPQLYENITNGPVINLLKCHIISRSIDLTEQYDFTSTFESISPTVIILFLLTVLLVASLWSLFARIKVASLIFPIIRIMIKNPPKIGLNVRSTIWASFIMFIFLLQTIILCFLKNGFISSGPKRNIETIKDMVNYNVNPITIGYSPCAAVITVLNDEHSKNLANRIKFIGLMFEEVVHTIDLMYSDENTVYFAGEEELDQADRAACLLRSELIQKKGKFLRSHTPFETRAQMLFINKNSKPFVRKRLDGIFSGAFEMRTQTLARFDIGAIKVITNAEPSISCLEMNVNTKNSIDFSPIHLTYFTKTAHFLIALIAFSINILLCEILIHLYN